MAMAETVSLTLNEAGYVVGQSSIAIDRGVIKAKLYRRGRHLLRRVGQAELRYIPIQARSRRISRLRPVESCMRRCATSGKGASA
jgi:hypothetical protein